MVNIAFLVGKGADNYIYKYTSKKAPTWLKNQVKNFIEFVDEDDKTVPSDVAMAMYIADHHKQDTVECILGSDVQSKRDIDKYDVVFVIFDAIEVFHGGCDKKTCPIERLRFERAVQTTSAFVYPYPDFHKYIIDKPRYYSDLRRAGINVAPFFKITPNTALKDIKALRNRVEKKGWKGVIIKPSYAGYSIGINVFKNFSRVKNTTLKRVFEKLEKRGFPSVTIQEFIPSFGNNFEIRTYWINGKYAYSVGTLTEAVGKGDGGLPISDEDTFVSEGGKIPDRIKRKLKIIGSEVFKALKQYPYEHPLLRIDFGCCLQTSECDDTYFVNEVETMAANLLAQDTNYPVVEKVAKTAYRFAKEVEGKKHPKGKKSNYKAKSKLCVLPP